MVMVKGKEVTVQDVARAVDSAKTVNTAADQRLLLVEPQEFISQALALRPESMATPPCHHGAAFTRFRPTLLAAALLAALWSAPTHAALNAVNYTVESDGTPGWDATDGPGLDTGPSKIGRASCRERV